MIRILNPLHTSHVNHPEQGRLHPRKPEASHYFYFILVVIDQPSSVVRIAQKSH